MEIVLDTLVLEFELNFFNLFHKYLTYDSFLYGIVCIYCFHLYLNVYELIYKIKSYDSFVI